MSSSRPILASFSAALVAASALVDCSGAETPSSGADAAPERSPDVGDAAPTGDATTPTGDATTPTGDAGDAGTTDGAAPFQCSGDAAPRGARALGMDILDVVPDAGFADNLAHLAAAHGSYQTLHLPWSAIESSAGSGAQPGTLVDPGGALAAVDAIATSSQVRVSLTLRPVDTTGKTVPSDLAAVDFASDAVVQRFEAVVDFALARLRPAHLVNLMIGNEVDTYDPGIDTHFWTSYGTFLADVTAYVHQKYPGLAVGFTATLGGWTTPGQHTKDGWVTAQVLAAWAPHVDAVGVTYYPLAADFTMKPPSVVSVDLAALVAAVPGAVPIHLQEVGYATASAAGASEQAQAAFVCEALGAWDVHADRIPLLAFLRLNDVTVAEAQTLAGPYGTASPIFVEYLRTLGLRDVTGAPKPAFDVLAAESARRGF